jgi:hypothetical protein
MNFKGKIIREMFTLINITFRHGQITMENIFCSFSESESDFGVTENRLHRALQRTILFGNEVWPSIPIKENSKLLSYIRFHMTCTMHGGNTIDLDFRICNRLFSLGDTIHRANFFSAESLKTTHIKLK